MMKVWHLTYYKHVCCKNLFANILDFCVTLLHQTWVEANSLLHAVLNRYRVLSSVFPQHLWSASVRKPRKPASEFSSHVRYMNIDPQTNASKNVSFDLHTLVMEGLGDAEISADINDHPTIKGPCQSQRCHREMKVTGNNNQVYFIILSKQKWDDELKWERKKKSEMHVKSPPIQTSSTNPPQPPPPFLHSHLFQFVMLCSPLYRRSGQQWGKMGREIGISVRGVMKHLDASGAMPPH